VEASTTDEQEGEGAMRKIFVVALLAAIGVTAFWAGSAVSGQEEEAKKPQMPMMPPKPAELKALDVFVGDWKSEFEFLPAMMGSPGKGMGKFHCDWVLDGWFIMGKGMATSNLGPHESIWIATYNPKMQKYQSYSFESHGENTVTPMTYDPATQTWMTVSQGTDMKSGKPAEDKMTMKFTSKDTLEWEWLQKVEGAEEYTLMMKGTDTRVTPG
jgi:hypothetical protein